MRRVHYTKPQMKSWLEDHFPEIDWTEVIEQLPPIIWRSRWDRYADRLGLPYTRKYIQNLDSRGQGPTSVEIE